MLVESRDDLISLRDHRRNELIACATLVVAIRSAACVNADAVTPAVLLAYAIVYAVSCWNICANSPVPPRSNFLPFSSHASIFTFFARLTFP